MGLKASASGTLEVLAPAPFSISLIPATRSVRQNDAVQTVSYRVLFARAGGYLGPIYLDLLGMAGGRYRFARNPIPAGMTETEFIIDTKEHPLGSFPFQIDAYEDSADIPGGWPPEV